MRLTLLLVCLLGLGFIPAEGFATPAPNPCEAPNEAAGTITALSHVAAALKPGSTLNVLAVGSATMFGPEAALLAGRAASPAPHAGHAGLAPGQVITSEPSELGFPRRMAKWLEFAVPGTQVDVTVRGGRGLSAAEMLEIIKAALAERTYQLVMWQTGTIEAVRNIPTGEFAQILADGAEAVQAANADLVLIDPQFSRFLQTNSNLDPYEQAFQQVASLPNVMLFRRFDLMHVWANEGQIDLERTSKADRKKVVEMLHACLGAQLGRIILAGARL